MSARLMMLLKDGKVEGEVLCDDATFRRSRDRADFEGLPPVAVKGKEHPVPVHRISQRAEGVSGSLPAAFGSRGWHTSAPERPLVGRDAEMQLILARAAGVVSAANDGGGAGGVSGAVIIEGDTGMGKTKLLGTLKATLHDMAHGMLLETAFGSRSSFHIFSGAGEVAHKSDAFFPWRRVFMELFQTDRLFSCGRVSSSGMAVSSGNWARPLAESSQVRRTKEADNEHPRASGERPRASGERPRASARDLGRPQAGFSMWDPESGGEATSTTMLGEKLASVLQVREG